MRNPIKRIKVLFPNGETKVVEAVSPDHHLIYELKNTFVFILGPDERWRAVKAKPVGVLWGEYPCLILTIRKNNVITQQFVPLSNIMVPYKRGK
jgi:hypothetical protein